jgi:hypothetical protein
VASTKAPVVFIHGLWLHASSWAPWQELLGEAGYESSAPGWPGDADTVEATRAAPVAQGRDVQCPRAGHPSTMAAT